MRESSGDQKGRSQSVGELVICAAMGEFKSRTKTWRTPLVTAVNAMLFPSFENMGECATSPEMVTGRMRLAARLVADGGINHSPVTTAPNAMPARTPNAASSLPRRGLNAADGAGATAASSSKWARMVSSSRCKSAVEA